MYHKEYAATGQLCTHMQRYVHVCLVIYLVGTVPYGHMYSNNVKLTCFKEVEHQARERHANR